MIRQGSKLGSWGFSPKHIYHPASGFTPDASSLNLRAAPSQDPSNLALFPNIRLELDKNSDIG